MLFTNGSFFILVAITFALFYLPILRRWQTYVLIASSLVFYALNQISYLALLAISIALNSFTSQAIYFAPTLKRARTVAVVGLVATLLILFYFKYAKLLGNSLPATITGPGGPGHFLLEVILPVGISFFTFEGISLVVDTFRARGMDSFFGDTSRHPGKHLLRTTLFVSFFPHLVAGPILKAHDFFPQIKPKTLADIDWDFVFRRLVIGYFLKMVVADSLKEHTFVMASPQIFVRSSLELLLLLFGFSMQIFADFAGYSLIAIGVAALFGYRLPENFNFPYIASSFSEFWRRWHISLSSWLREYLYFPLGGNRKGAVRTYFNLFMVMFLGGLWHGAAWSYAVWGSVHGLALAIERLLTGEKKSDIPDSFIVRAFKIAIVFSVVTAAWLLFKLPQFSDVVQYVQAIGRQWSIPTHKLHCFSLIFYSLPVIIYHIAYLMKPKMPVGLMRVCRPVAYGAMVFLLVVNRGSPGEFIYFQF